MARNANAFQEFPKLDLFCFDLSIILYHTFSNKNDKNIFSRKINPTINFRKFTISIRTLRGLTLLPFWNSELHKIYFNQIVQISHSPSPHPTSLITPFPVLSDLNFPSHSPPPTRSLLTPLPLTIYFPSSPLTLITLHPSSLSIPCPYFSFLDIPPHISHVSFQLFPLLIFSFSEFYSFSHLWPFGTTNFIVFFSMHSLPSPPYPVTSASLTTTFYSIMYCSS